MKPKTDDEIYDDYIDTFPEKERELLRPHKVAIKDTYGFACYILGVRIDEFTEALKEASIDAYEKFKKIKIPLKW